MVTSHKLPLFFEGATSPHEPRVQSTVHLSDRHTLSNRWTIDGYMIFESVVDGNCMFDALAHQLKCICNKSKTAECVRHEIVEFLKVNPGVKNKISADVLGGTQPQQYLSDMQKSGSWGDGVMLSAASLLYETPIKIVMQGNKYFFIGEGNTHREPITVGYVPLSGTTPNHFVSLIRSTHADGCGQSAVSGTAKCTTSSSSTGARESSETTHADKFDEASDLTNRPDEQLLASASRDFSGRQRSPQADWFITYPWLQFSRSRKVVFCSWCRATTHCYVTGMIKCEPAFTEKGFNNWKKGSEKLAEHSLSTAHRAAALFVAKKTTPSVAAQINTQMAKEQEQSRNRLLVEIHSVIFLMRQGLALRRGKDEANDNLHQVMELLARSGVVEARECLSSRIHLSHDIVNELCNLVGQRVLRMVLSEFSSLRAISKYSILGDETRDASGTEQLSVCFRWVDESLSVHEDFLGLYSLSGHGQTAEVLTHCLKDVLVRVQLPFADLHGQGYDGASAMAGAVSGVAQRMKDVCPNAHFTHCLAHCLNLAVSDSAKTVPLMQFALDLVHQLVTFIRHSCKRTDIFHDVQQESKQQSDYAEGMHISPNISLRPLCPTRWTVKASAINSVICNYEHLMMTLECIQSDRRTPTGNCNSQLK